MKFGDAEHIQFMRPDGTVDEEALRQYKEWVAGQDPAFLAEIDRKAREGARAIMNRVIRGKNTFEHVAE